MKIEYDRLIGPGGHYLTQALFFEFRHQTGSEYIPFTMKERDWKGHLSVYKIYMSCQSEYEAALKLLNSWKHWEVLCEAPWFAKELEKWREERSIREAALGKAVLIEQAESGNVTAAKILLDGATKKRAGRPTKESIQAERKKQAAIDNKVSSIIERMSNK